MCTVDILESKKACLDQIKLFKEHFPDGAPMTVEAAIKVASVFDWGWAANHLLSSEGRKAYEEGEASLFASIYIKENTK